MYTTLLTTTVAQLQLEGVHGTCQLDTAVQENPQPEANKSGGGFPSGSALFQPACLTFLASQQSHR